jgi:hypothetical protein
MNEARQCLVYDALPVEEQAAKGLNKPKSGGEDAEDAG